MTTVEILRATRKLIEDPKDWCGKGWGEWESSPRCLLNALEAVTASFSSYNPAYAALERATEMPRNVGNFNDTHTHAEVLAAVDRAIANEEAKEAEFDVPDEFVQAIKETVNV